tara:strand:- start:50 stop:505 length:456 start_codon:yes stop_codon:yes gene_type:complete
MKLEIKKIKSFRGHDGQLGFSGDLYFDGKFVAHALDDAWGGGFQFDYEPKHEATMEVLYEYGRKKYPEFAKTGGASDIILSELLDKIEQHKWLKRNAKKKTMWTLPTHKEGEYMSIKRLYDQHTKSVILKKYPDATILNEQLRDGIPYLTV